MRKASVTVAYRFCDGMSKHSCCDCALDGEQNTPTGSGETTRSAKVDFQGCDLSGSRTIGNLWRNATLLMRFSPMTASLKGGGTRRNSWRRVRQRSRPSCDIWRD